ncbi:ATP-dependent DNA helicase RecG [soil metagenome]
MKDEMPIEALPRTSGLTIKRLKTLGIETYDDLCHYYPSRYEDFHVISAISRVKPGELVTLKGTITSFSSNRTKRGFALQKALLTDGTGKIDLVWYNQPFLANLLQPPIMISVAGVVETFGNSINMKPQEYEILNSAETETIHTARLVPIYPQVYGLSSKTIREKMFGVLKYIAESDDKTDYLPAEIKKSNNLIDEKQAFQYIHFPQNFQEEKQAKDRLGFDELFIKLLSSRLVRKEWEKEQVTHSFKLNKPIQSKIDKFIAKLPFKLTTGQQKATDEILQDLGKKTPMNRFLQGDVGSGKTVVSAVAAYVAYLNGFQTLYMVPTEILAQQHYGNLKKMLEPLGIKIALQTGSNKTFTKKDQNTDDYHIILGTHALITSFLSFERVGLVIIDEQHRFGVKQRALLKQKGLNPHLLTMTATPIPRTVSLTLYSELDLSVIDEMPKGRLPIKTHVVPHEKRKSGYEWIKKQIDAHGIQAYIICPLVEVSESETMQSIKAATKEYEMLRDQIFKKYKVALLHGKMKPKEKEEVMRHFKEKKYDILVSTSVVEVGIDVPNATIMIIEGAERFGLAQLHQLRGRVGRGNKQSYCFPFTSDRDMKNTGRLKFFSNTTSGMKLSEFDLKIRGPGDMYGTQQSGYSDLKIASITDYPLIKKVKDSIDYFENIYLPKKYPELKKRLDIYQTDQVSRD